MKVIRKTDWVKHPSVTREGKFFYRAVVNGLRWTVLQSPLSDKWIARTDGGGEIGTFETSAKAKRAAEKALV